MKLAEALILRSDAQKRIAQLQERLVRSAQVQEGETPPEDPQQLLAELEATLAELEDLIKRINRTNSTTNFDEGTLSDVLAERDVLTLKRNAYNRLIQQAAIRPQRYGLAEVRFLSTVDIAALQQHLDRLSRDYRELDSQIQASNWETDLIEVQV